MRLLQGWGVTAIINRIDSHVYFEGILNYKWKDDDKHYTLKFNPKSAMEVYVFEELIKRNIIRKIEKVDSEDFFCEETFHELEVFFQKHSRVVWSTNEEFKPRAHFEFHVNINLIRTDEVLFDLLLWGYKDPIENVLMPVEVFHSFIDRLKPKITFATVHGVRKLKIFLSHASEDKQFVKRLADDLFDRGLLVWYDEWEIKGGQSITERIKTGIEESAFMAVVLSKNSVDKGWVKKEIEQGLFKEIDSKKMYILPILLDECSIPKEFKDRRYANFLNNYEDGLVEFLKFI